MKTEVKIAGLSESVAEGTVGSWLKDIGDRVSAGETIVEVETDKVVLEIPAPVDGVLEQILKQPNDSVVNNDVIGLIQEQAAATSPATPTNDQHQAATEPPNNSASDVPSPTDVTTEPANALTGVRKTSPAVRKLLAENDVAVEDIQPSGKHGRIKKSDVIDHMNRTQSSAPKVVDVHGLKEVERVPMSSLRKRVAARLVSAQQEYAMLTTFNEVNMQAILDIRKKYKEQFQAAHGVKLGFMSFFSLAVTEALKKYPIVNASVEDDHILYHRYVDLGIAVSSERGLVVPVIRNAGRHSLSSLELAINELASKARDNKLEIEDLIGGTFTITNGGVFGSMMSTPIINPPQSAILGMHTIQKRPIAEDDQVVIRPMMYIALSYDHRIIDGREAVLFLSDVKQTIEDPINLLLHI